MENKYYTPSIEDICVGYECEREDSIEGYKPYVFDLEGIRNFAQDEISDYRESFYRTLFLTKEQIEKEGWEFKQTNKIRYWYGKTSPEVKGKWYGYCIYRAKLIHDPEMKYVRILFSFDAVEEECVFEGYCPSVNEFRKIQKLLKIK